jgi:tRNA/tmRNA/rRNA uracil-C5-methylase (TrmA/RlmC/RlmD family)
VLLWGEDAIEEEILGLRFRVRPNAFLQTNTEMAETLYSIARDFAGLTGGETVYDLYCGTGTIGLALASQALTVWGVEISEESVACAIENAELNGSRMPRSSRVTSTRARGAARARRAARCRRRRSAACRLAGKALRRMARLKARIAYVSCN